MPPGTVSKYYIGIILLN